MFSFRRLLFLAAVAVAFAVVAPSRGDPPPPAPPPPGAAAVNRARELLWDLARRPELAPLVDYWRSADYRSHRLAGEVRSPSDLVECAICVDMLAALVGGWQDGSYTLEEMEEGLKDLCLQLEMLSEAGCDGIVENYAPVLEYIYFEEETPTETFCALYFSETKCDPVATLEQWEVEVDQDYPPTETPVAPEPDMPTQKVLHISDIHVDLTYTPGAHMTCADELCCTNSSGMADPGDGDAAGYWGEYTCDIPLWTAQHVLLHAAEEHPDVDFILLTGDFPAHDVYYQGRGFNLEAAEASADLVSEAFPGVPIYPSMGNHEAFPCNSFPTDAVPSDLDASWLYDGLADIYSEWLDDDAEEQFREAGYYTTLISPGFRFIAVNSMFGYTQNFWLGYEYQDANGQLQWMHDTLLAAEAAGEKAWILSHLPPGQGGAYGAWGREYTRIVERFENTVANQFFGHSHKDHFKVFYDTATSLRPTSFGFISPSITPHTNVNLAYRIYTVDGDYEGTTRRVIDFDTYIGDLSQAGEDESEPPPYSLLYNAKSDLELSALLPEDYDALVRRLRDDDDFFDRYNFYYYSGSAEGETWTEEDREQIICRAVTTDSEDSSKCDDVLSGG